MQSGSLIIAYQPWKISSTAHLTRRKASSSPANQTWKRQRIPHSKNGVPALLEGHLLDEDRWFQEHEQEVCELLLPLMLASGLFDDEPEFREILKDPKLAEDMCSQIPEVLMELYLMFNSPEEIRNKKEKRTIN